MTQAAVEVRPYARGPVPLPTGEEAAEVDRRAIDELGVPQSALMEAAGRAAADVLERLFPSGPVVGLIGAGNNGGDGLVLLRTLAARGREARAILVGDRPTEDPLLHGWPVIRVRDSELATEDDWFGALAGAAVLVDGILGTGIQGAPRDRQAVAIRAANEHAAPMLALDLPSGVDAATGAVEGDAVRAHATVGFGWPKLGSLLSPGREYAGRVIAVEIGFPPEAGIGQEAITASWTARHRPRRTPDTHKNAVGALLLVAGRKGMAGAAVLAGRAAIRAGAGFLRVASVPENREVLQGALPEAVFVDITDPNALDEALESSRALAVGPGLGTASDAAVGMGGVLGTDRPRVLDADALNLIAAGEGPSLDELGAGAPTLITPHPGEMDRLDAGGEATDPVTRARAMASAHGLHVLLKGMPSVVADPEGRVLVDTTVTSDLAKAGIGDVLSGVAGAFLAQGVDPSTAGALALYHCGRAAVRAGRGAGMSPEDVADQLPAALAELGPGTTDLALSCVTFDLDAPR